MTSAWIQFVLIYLEGYEFYVLNQLTSETQIWSWYWHFDSHFCSGQSTALTSLFPKYHIGDSVLQDKFLWNVNWV